MKPYRASAEDYRDEANRLRQQAIEIADSFKRIELLDKATYYEMLAATAETTNRHRLGRWILPG